MRRVVEGGQERRRSSSSSSTAAVVRCGAGVVVVVVRGVLDYGRVRGRRRGLPASTHDGRPAGSMWGLKKTGSEPRGWADGQEHARPRAMMEVAAGRGLSEACGVGGGGTEAQRSGGAQRERPVD